MFGGVSLLSLGCCNILTCTTAHAAATTVFSLPHDQLMRVIPECYRSEYLGQIYAHSGMCFQNINFSDPATCGAGQVLFGVYVDKQFLDHLYNILILTVAKHSRS